jgi:putative ATPase
MARGGRTQQPTLFGETPAAPARAHAPLAERMRPRTLDEYVGQSHLIAPGHLLHGLIQGQRLHSLILWGPPGTGKTTLAYLIARHAGANAIPFSAVLSGDKDLRAAIEDAQATQRIDGKPSVLVVDEIHRFNKAQQDAFLPYVEDGTIVLIGATTENPSFEIIAPLLSRASVVVLEPLSVEHLQTILSRALMDTERGLGNRNLTIEAQAMAFLIAASHGDARSALNLLETAADLADARKVSQLTVSLVEEAAQHRAVRYDKAGDEHYNVISAFIKSLRGSDPDAAVYWLMRMLEAGEDPLFIARRLVIFAAEDIGTAEPQALGIAVAAKDAVHFVGLPEGQIPLAAATAYLATAPKSNAAYRAMQAAAADVQQHGALAVPLHLRNAPTRLMKGLGYGKGYKYAHDDADHVVDQSHLPSELAGRRYYVPSRHGAEATIAERLERWEAIRRRRDPQR